MKYIRRKIRQHEYRVIQSYRARIVTVNSKEVLCVLKILIVTNNRLVHETYGSSAACTVCSVKTCYVDGDVESLLIKVRDMVHEGYPLLSHPLPASIRMIYSPYRSVMLGAISGKLEPWHVKTIEDSLTKYRRSTGHRALDSASEAEYKWMDMQLLTTAMNEPLPFAE